MSAFTLRREFSIGEIAITVLLALVLAALCGLGYFGWRTQQRESADAIRRSAAVVAAKVSRQAELEARLFEDLQVSLIDVSEKVAETHATQPANRMFYRALGDAIAKSSQRMLDEDLDAATMDLFRQVPEFQRTFDDAVYDMRRDERRVYDELSMAIQSALRDPEVLKLPGSPEIGNVLRTKVASIDTAFTTRIARVAHALWCDANGLVGLSDADLLNPERRQDVLDSHPVPKLEPAQRD